MPSARPHGEPRGGTKRTRHFSGRSGYTGGGRHRTLSYDGGCTEDDVSTPCGPR